MGIAEDLADELADQVIDYLNESDDEYIIADIVKVLGSSSQTAEEAFLTAIRVRRANIAARELLAKRVKSFRDAKTKPADNTME